MATKKPTAPAVQQEEAQVQIPGLGVKVIEVPIRGVSPLIVHQFSEKARKMMAEKQAGAARKKKEPKVPENDYRESLYVLPGKPNAYGFPAVGFKKAMISACRHVDGIPMTMARGAFHVVATHGDLVEIMGTPEMRTDTVRLETGVADIRYRGEFRQWKARLTIRYMATSITPSQLLHILNVAGFAVGVGENRPEKSGASFGQFEIDADEFAKMAEAS